MNKNFEQMLRLVDYVDGLMVVDKNCIIRHFYTAYPDLVNLRQDEPLNRSLFEIYPTLKREDSYICRALETGESFINYEQTYINYKGRCCLFMARQIIMCLWARASSSIQR